MIGGSLNSTLGTALPRPHISDTHWYPIRGILSTIAMFRQLTSSRLFCPDKQILCNFTPRGKPEVDLWRWGKRDFCSKFPWRGES